MKLNFSKKLKDLEKKVKTESKKINKKDKNNKDGGKKKPTNIFWQIFNDDSENEKKN